MARYQFSAADRQRGGKARASQETFIDHQREAGRKGAAALMQKPGGFAALLDKVADYHRTHPSNTERWVMETLAGMGYEEGRDYQREVRVNIGGREFLLDFVIGRVVLEPGDRRWHGTAEETIDGVDHAAKDAARDAWLRERAGLTVVRLDATQIARQPEQVREQLAEVLGAVALAA